MGYNSDYFGSIEINPPLKQDMVEYMNRLFKTRRMKRDVNVLIKELKGTLGFRGYYGTDGEFYTGADSLGTCAGPNTPPSTQPNLWCLLEVSQDGSSIYWNGDEDFEDAVKWFEYVIEKFIKPEGSVCNGTINVRGDDSNDMWNLVITNNKVSEISMSADDLQDTIAVLSDHIAQASHVIEGYKKALGDIGNTTVGVESVLTFLNLVQDKLRVRRDE